jgi:hypothetical protein
MIFSITSEQFGLKILYNLNYECYESEGSSKKHEVMSGSLSPKSDIQLWWLKEDIKSKYTFDIALWQK